MSFRSHVILVQRLVALQIYGANQIVFPHLIFAMCFILAEYETTLTLQALTFHRCKDLKIRNLMLINSQQMHLSFTNCMRVVASHLKVLAPASSPNTDGIHISATKGVQVRDSVIRTGTAAVQLFSTKCHFRLE